MSGLTGPSCRRQKRRQPRCELDLHLPADIVVGAAPPSRGDELELTLAVGSASRSKRRDEGSGTPLASSLSSTDTGGLPYQRAMAFRLQEGTAIRQQQAWLVECLGLRMA